MLHLDYRFESKGPKGTIEKIVRYELKNKEGSTYFELEFGDWDDKIKEINHMIVSNNSDREKILGTVAETVLELTEKFPDLVVYATGSTSSRTRLYQIMISVKLKIIESQFEVFGLTNEGWQPFQKNITYDAFTVHRKHR